MPAESSKVTPADGIRSDIHLDVINCHCERQNMSFRVQREIPNDYALLGLLLLDDLLNAERIQGSLARPRDDKVTQCLSLAIEWGSLLERWTETASQRHALSGKKRRWQPQISQRNFILYFEIGFEPFP